MKIVGCDLHARQQSIALLDRETGEFPRLWRPSGEERDVRQLLIHRYTNWSRLERE